MRALLIISLLLLPAITQAQKPNPKDRVVQFKELRVFAKPQVPEAFYILQRTELGFDRISLKKSFLPRILKSVEGQAF